MAVRTWAPRGETPVLRVPLTRDHLSSISGITLDGRLFLQVRLCSYDSAAVVGFLRVLMRKISGKLVVIWDGRLSIGGSQSRTFSKEELPNACNCSNCRGMPLISILMRASGIIEKPRGVSQCLLSGSRSVASRTYPGKRTLTTQKRDHSELFSAMWLLALVASHEISSSF
jgi:hypothetical protein